MNEGSTGRRFVGWGLASILIGWGVFDLPARFAAEHFGMAAETSLLGFFITQTLGVALAAIGAFSLAATLWAAKESRTDGNILMLIFGAAACTIATGYVLLLMVGL